MSIFPLPLTPFEYLFWCDDTPEYPTTFPIALQFTGVLDRQAFTSALRSAVERHPMLCALVDAGGPWPFWVLCLDQPPELDWSDDDRPLAHRHGVRIDLTRHPGLRVWVRSDGERTYVYLQIHHACCDGLAVQLFVEDLLLLYCRNIGVRDATMQPRPLDAQLLRHRRGWPVVTDRRMETYRRIAASTGSTLRTWGQLLRRNPAVLAGQSLRSEGAATPLSDDLADVFGFLTHTFNAQQMLRFKQVATRKGVTTNDLLLRDLFRAMDRWNRDQGDETSRWLRINVPANERVPADRAMPAANRLSFTFLTRDRRDCQHPNRLLRSIRAETQALQRSRAGTCFLHGLAAASQVRGMIPWFLRCRRSFATVCLSNVGRVLARTALPRQRKHVVCGDAVLDRISGTPFIRPATRAAITIISYANEMTVNLRCDQRYLNQAQRQLFLKQYVGIIEKTLG